LEKGNSIDFCNFWKREISLIFATFWAGNYSHFKQKINIQAAHYQRKLKNIRLIGMCFDILSHSDINMGNAALHKHSIFSYGFRGHLLIGYRPLNVNQQNHNLISNFEL
jgi:hypothetical protein